MGAGGRARMDRTPRRMYLVTGLMSLPNFRVAPLSAEISWALSIVFFLVVGAIAGWLAYDAWRCRRERCGALRRLAVETAAEKGMGPKEAALLERIVLDEGAMPGPRGFERHAETFLREGVPPATVESLRLQLGFDRARSGMPLVSTRQVDIGQDLTLTDAENVWRAGVVDLDETALVLKIPAEAAAVLRAGDAVKASFWRDLDARYFLQTTVRGVRTRPAPLLYLHHPAQIERFQDREHVRASVDWKIPVTKLSAEEFQRAVHSPVYSESIEGRPVTVEVVDVSAGGLRLKSTPVFAVQDHVVVEVPSSERRPPNGHLLVLARVVAADDRFVRCEFLGLTQSERDEIHREILRARRRKPTA